jgi:antitoxin (DNA-binding transcriptional repressor) of toxin-antitoxin stability system
MGQSNTIQITDLMNQDSILKMISEIQNHGVNFSLVQNGVEVARVVPVEETYTTPTSNEQVAKRLAALEKMEILSKKVARLWNTEETATEAVAHDRR